jgi:helicase SWR1
LTGADTVIFYDSDYNPSMDKQCEDRAHRIGQIHDVHIYRFISQHTVEESMLRKANQKRSLDDIVIQQGEFDWRKILIDDIQMEQALAVVEDKADVEAAKMAAAEVIEENDFQFDASATTVPQGQEAQDGEGDGKGEDDVILDETGGVADEEEEADEVGSSAEYIVRFVERDWDVFSDWRVK